MSENNWNPVTVPQLVLVHWVNVAQWPCKEQMLLLLAPRISIQARLVQYVCTGGVIDVDGDYVCGACLMLMGLIGPDKPKTRPQK